MRPPMLATCCEASGLSIADAGTTGRTINSSGLSGLDSIMLRLSRRDRLCTLARRASQSHRRLSQRHRDPLPSESEEHHC